MKGVKIKNVQLYHNGDIETEFIFSDAHEALLSMIYLKIGLIFIKPQNENHILFPDNLREYHNLMQLLNSLESVVDKTGKITAPKSTLRKNLNSFKHYFLDSWVKQNLSRTHQEDLIQFVNEPVESKNKLIYFKLMHYVDTVKKNTPESIDASKKENNDNYRIKKDTPSYNVSLANVFEAMNQLDLQKENKNMLGAIGVAYSIIAFELMYFTNNLHELYNGKVMGFSYVENRTYGLYGSDAFKGRNIGLVLQNLSLKTPEKIISLKELNEAIKKHLKTWESAKNIEKSKSEASKMAQIFSLIFAYLFIYNGYYAAVSDDGTTLGKKFYERAVYFRQGRYSLAPSGFFYKVLNLKRVLELTLLEKLDNSVEIDEKGDIIFGNSDEEEESRGGKYEWLLSEKTKEWVFKSKEILSELHEIGEPGFEKEFINAWIKLLEVCALDDTPLEILPYCSFEMLKSISDEQIIKSVSKYRKNGGDSIKRFMHVDERPDGSTTGFINDINSILSDLDDKSAYASKLAFKSPLAYYYNQYKSISSIFSLFKYYEFQSGKNDLSKESKSVIKEEESSFNTDIYTIYQNFLQFYEKVVPLLKISKNRRDEFKDYCNLLDDYFHGLKDSKGYLLPNEVRICDLIKVVDFSSHRDKLLYSLDQLLSELSEYISFQKEPTLQEEI